MSTGEMRRVARNFPGRYGAVDRDDSAVDAMAEFEFVDGPRSIERENHLAKVSVTANATHTKAERNEVRFDLMWTP